MAGQTTMAKTTSKKLLITGCITNIDPQNATPPPLVNGEGEFTLPPLQKVGDLFVGLGIILEPAQDPKPQPVKSKKDRAPQTKPNTGKSKAKPSAPVAAKTKPNTKPNTGKTKAKSSHSAAAEPEPNAPKPKPAAKPSRLDTATSRSAYEDYLSGDDIFSPSGDQIFRSNSLFSDIGHGARRKF